jgi:predicted nucleic acid-binding protein
VRVLLDTNVLLRLAEGETGDSAVRAAVVRLKARDEQLCFTMQNIIELWNVCTRPTSSNGLGVSMSDVEVRARILDAQLTRLPEDDRIYAVWRRLVREQSVSGAQVHDARLAAAMLVHEIPSILTLNGRDFARYPGITVLTPQDV